MSLALEVSVNSRGFDADDDAVFETAPIIAVQAATKLYSIRTWRLCQACNDEEDSAEVAGEARGGQLGEIRGVEIAVVQDVAPFAIAETHSRIIASASGPSGVSSDHRLLSLTTGHSKASQLLILPK